MPCVSYGMLYCIWLGKQVGILEATEGIDIFLEDIRGM